MAWVLLAGPEETGREEALQLKRMEIPRRKGEGKQGEKHHGRRQWLGEKQVKSRKPLQKGKVREDGEKVGNGMLPK